MIDFFTVSSPEPQLSLPFFLIKSVNGADITE